MSCLQLHILVNRGKNIKSTSTYVHLTTAFHGARTNLSADWMKSQLLAAVSKHTV